VARPYVDDETPAPKWGVPEALPPALARWMPDLTDEVTWHRWVRIVVVLIIAGVIGFLVTGGQRPPDPVVVESSAASSVEPFDQMAFRIRPPATRADAVELADLLRCALLADTPELRSQGLGGRSDLAGYDGMLFVFDADTSAGFHMRDVHVPLSIGFFDADGFFVSSTTMDPCPAVAADCPTHTAEGPFRYALEASRGRLGAMGVEPGSRLHLAGACTARPAG
jgi:uncharacterized membrane protein (UPF0127 family)